MNTAPMRGAVVLSGVPRLKEVVMHLPEKKVVCVRRELCSGVDYGTAGCGFSANDCSIHVKCGVRTEMHIKQGKVDSW